MTRGTDPHIFLVRALLDAGLTEKDITPVLLQHPDGKTALIRGDVDAWAGLDPMMAQAEVEDGAKLFFRKPEANTWGILNVREEFLKDHPDLVRRVLAVYEAARKHSLANYADVKRVFIAATKLPEAVVDKQLKERTELTHSRIGAPQKESILAAGLALQQAGVIKADVDVKATVDESDRRPLGGGDELSARISRSITSPRLRERVARRAAGERDSRAHGPLTRRSRSHPLPQAGEVSRHAAIIPTLHSARPMSLFSMTLAEPARRSRRDRVRSRASPGPRSASCCRWASRSLWEIAVRAGYSDGRLVPPPSRIWATLVELAAAGELQRHVAVTVCARRGRLCASASRPARSPARSPAIRRCCAACSIRPCRRCARSRRSPGCRCSSSGSGFSNPRRSR